MKDTEIIQLIIYCTSRAKEEGYKLLGGTLNVSWNDQENKWVSKGNTCSCLSAILLMGQKIPDVQLQKSDDVATSTLAVLLDRSASWIESFLDAYSGGSNAHTSINGYVMGVNMRKHFPPFKE